MRKDMAKVIVERPRVGGSGREGIARQDNLDPEDLPAKESMKFSHRRSRKELNENLAPLERFLNSRIGKYWNDVYKEICANISSDSAVQAHILQHVKHMVEKDVVIKKNHPFILNRWDGFSPLRKGALYVHPEDGILYRVEKNFKIKYKGAMPKKELELLEKLLAKFEKVTSNSADHYGNEGVKHCLIFVRRYIKGTK